MNVREDTFFMTLIKIGFVGFVVMLGYAVYYFLKKYWGSKVPSSNATVIVPDIMVHSATERHTISRSEQTNGFIESSSNGRGRLAISLR